MLWVYSRDVSRIVKKNPLYLSVNVFSTKVLIGDTSFTSPTGMVTQGCHTRSSLLQGKGSTLFLSYFKTQSIGPAQGIKPTTSRPAVKHSILTNLILCGLVRLPMT